MRAAQRSFAGTHVVSLRLHMKGEEEGRKHNAETRRAQRFRRDSIPRSFFVRADSKGVAAEIGVRTDSKGLNGLIEYAKKRRQIESELRRKKRARNSLIPWGLISSRTPPRLFCEKSVEVIENERLDFLHSAKEATNG